MSMPRTLFWLPVLGILSAVVVLAACGGSGGPELPDTAAASVVDYLEEVDYQNNDDWKLFPGSTKKYEGRDPHGMLLTTYVNPAAFEAIEDDATTPSGSIIVKENYMPDGNLAATTIMYKKSGLQSRPQRLVLAQGTDRRHRGKGRYGTGLPGLPCRAPGTTSGAHSQGANESIVSFLPGIGPRKDAERYLRVSLFGVRHPRSRD